MKLRWFEGFAVHVVFTLLLSGAGILAHATTYYVAKTGSDSNACTATAPCLTISHGASKATSAGDIVQVSAGTYSESPKFSSSGSSTSAITFRGQTGSGCPTTAVSDVNNPTGSRPAPTVIVSGGFTIAANYVTIDCFHIKSNGSGAINVQAGSAGGVISSNDLDGTGNSGPGPGISFAGLANTKSTSYSSNFKITANYIHGTSTGIFFVCSSCTVSDNEITALAGDEPGTDHDYIDAWGTSSTFRHNYMHANTCNSCQGYDCHMDCIQTWNTTGDGTEVSKNITFDGNVCFNHHEGVIVQDNAGNGDVSNWTVTNNVFAYGPYDDGSGHLCAAGTAHPWCWVFEDGTLGSNNNFLNNTCIDGSEGFRNTNGSAQFKDNLFLSLGGTTTMYQLQGASSGGANNLYYAANGSFGSGSFTGDIINKNPQVISAGTGSGSSQCIGCNFNIQSTSPAINAGVSTGPTVTTDLRGTPRPQGTAYDIGAYEFVPTMKPAAPTALSGVVK